MHFEYFCSITAFLYNRLNSLKIKSIVYHHLAGFRSRKAKLDKWTYEAEEESMTTISPNNYTTYEEYTMHE